MARPIASADTATRILDIAEYLVQTRGFNAFSYADVADALDVTKASLHYHFATKAELGGCLIERYRTSFLCALDRIDEKHVDAVSKLTAYVRIYADVLEHDRMCLCGMLAAEYATLPAPMRDGISQILRCKRDLADRRIERRTQAEADQLQRGAVGCGPGSGCRAGGRHVAGTLTAGYSPIPHGGAAGLIGFRGAGDSLDRFPADWKQSARSSSLYLVAMLSARLFQSG